MNLKTKHTFCVCAYKESPYLEECVRSLLRQSAKSRILIATSTPNPHIESIAEKYHIPLYVNEGEHGIVQDWNFAYSKADTPYVTIAHQDDLYFPSYAQRIVEKLERSDMPLIAFSGYCELRARKFYLLPVRDLCPGTSAGSCIYPRLSEQYGLGILGTVQPSGRIFCV